MDTKLPDLYCSNSSKIEVHQIRIHHSLAIDTVKSSSKTIDEPDNLIVQAPSQNLTKQRELTRSSLQFHMDARATMDTMVSSGGRMMFRTNHGRGRLSRGCGSRDGKDLARWRPQRRWAGSHAVAGGSRLPWRRGHGIAAGSRVGR